jgi:hypothetical protein
MVRTAVPVAPRILGALELFEHMRWIDGTSLVHNIEPYRRRLFLETLDARDDDGRQRYNLVLCGRAKKNWKSTDLALAALWAAVTYSPFGNQCYLLANDEDQAADDLSLLKKLIEANPVLKEWLVVKNRIIERRDHRGFIEPLPAGDVAGSHGKTYRFCGFDEIHAYKTWDVLEAMQLDPTRPDSIMWITSYASLYHRPGVPLFDLMKIGRAGTDPRMYFSWYGADYTSDPDFVNAAPEDRANPSRASWTGSDYIEQQRRRLPVHKFRRLHLNLPGMPEGAAFQAEPVMDSVERGVTRRPPEPGVHYIAGIDMSGGSNDDAVCAIAHLDADGRAVLDCIVNQGPPPPFDPRAAVDRFVPALRQYGVTHVIGDKYAGETFKYDFERHGITYDAAATPKTKVYEALEPQLNGRAVVLLDAPLLEQQLLGLIWCGGKIDHPAGEHDDWANSAAIALVVAASPAPINTDPRPEELAVLAEFQRHFTTENGIPLDIFSQRSLP